MQKLFWRIFVIVWLTMACSIALLFAISYAFKLFPFPIEVHNQQVSFALDVAARLLATDGPESAEKFVATALQAPQPIKLNLAAIGDAQVCSVGAEGAYERYVVNRGRCFLINGEAMRVAFLSRNLPRLVPWLSAMLAAAAAAYWLARYLTRPVAQLRNGLRALAQGRFDIRIGNEEDRKRDEIAALADDFNMTAARLQEFQEVQRRLFHDVSHELRSPLSRLQAALGVLHQNPTRLEAMIERLEREIAKMDDLVGEILTMARLTATGKEPLERQTLDLIDLVREIVDDSLFEASPNNISVFYSGVESFVTSVNGELIYRAIENVVRNAVKYSPSNSHVRVWSERTGQSFCLNVKDEGPGIPEVALDAMFQPFKRGNNLSATAMGFGLGLSITKRAFERHGGQVEAQPAEGGGLLVRMTLPV
ncbi:ATP-binding protein [Rhizobium sp. NPDC090279]|uniref:HAMP domain-containing sensor histidine kinase n=1 Tax=Rhizobium sp. NPDC090279 TaxID=3364499 RepID=UPI00383B7CD6